MFGGLSSTSAETTKRSYDTKLVRDHRIIKTYHINSDMKQMKRLR